MTEDDPKTIRVLATPLTPAQQELVLESRGFARKATRFYDFKYRGLLSHEDIEQLIHLALVESARLFDPEHGSTFVSFAWLRIGGALARAAGSVDGGDAELRRNLAACLTLQDAEIDLEADPQAIAARADEHARKAATALVFGIAGITPRDAAAPLGETPESELLREELRRTIEAAVAKLPERPRRLIDAYYLQGRTLREASTELHVSYATVRRDHDDAIEQIREVCVRAGYESDT